jgi:hypothetical protein
VNERCASYGQAGRDNLTIRKIYAKDQIRYLRCRCCGAEFSERKNTALWNTKVREEKAVSVADHLAEGCSLKATARLAKMHPSGEASYASLFPEIFGIAYQPSRQGCRGRLPKRRYRIPRTLAHV